MSALAGRLAIVTGASRGIGAAVAAAFGAAGARVVRVARSFTPGTHDGVHDIPCDMSDPAAVARLTEDVLTRLGTPDIVVNNAGIFDRIPFEQADPSQLERHLAVNLVGPFALARGFLPPMRVRGSGLLVTVGSIADHVAFPENTIYSTTKYGLRGLHETLAVEYRGTGVRCTLVSPGPTDTALWDAVDPDNRPGFVPRHAMLRPADVAEAILFVATRPPNVQVDWLRLNPAL
ncbi:MAG TPA: SDR family NAD(P)-dependent oxidoreductase [Gemmatimonadales bacterium]|nr:SDR family NAD(P)-dependent oxidoreductase [Gemmatimonadales bacterium]